MITMEEAVQQGRAYDAAAKGSRVAQCKVTLARQAREWKYAVEMLDDLGDGYAVALFTEVVPGMVVADERGDMQVVRKLEQGGQVSLHLESRESPSPTYRNFAGQLSPVVVLDVPFSSTPMPEPTEDEAAE